MRSICISLIAGTFIMHSAFAQDMGPGAPEVEMDTPSMDMETNMPGQDGMSQDRDGLLLEKSINDIKQARGELAAMSAWEAPDTLSEEEREEWEEQSRRLEAHIGTLEELSSRLQEVVDKGGSGNTDYDQVKSEARAVISELHNDVTTRNMDGDMAVERQRAVADSLDSVSIL